MSTGQLVQDSTGHVRQTRPDRQQTLKGLSVRCPVHEEGIPPTAKTIGVTPGELIRCFRNWQSDDVGTVVWCGSMRTPLTNWPEWGNE
jgi:hypothetical protein